MKAIRSNHMKSLEEPILYGLAFLGGAASLVCQIVWFGYLRVLMGSDARATAYALGLFLGGLSTGYALAACIRRASPRKNFILCSVMQSVLAAWAVAFPHLFAGVSKAADAAAGLGISAAPMLEILGACFLVFPPAVLMGCTLPLVTQCLVAGKENPNPHVARLYGANTAGAFLGCMGAGFAFIAWWGFRASLYAAGAAYLCLSSGFALLAAKRPDTGEILQPPKEPVRQGFLDTLHWRRASLLLICLLSGASLVTLESLMMRLTAAAVGSSAYVYPTVAGAFILCIAAGALFASLLSKSGPRALAAVLAGAAAALIPIYLTGENWPYFAHALHGRLHPTGLSFPMYSFLVADLLTLLFFVPVGLAGASLPLAFNAWRGSANDAGRTVGLLFAANALGNLLGGLLGGYLAYYVLESDSIFRWAIILPAMASCLAAGISASTPAWRLAAGFAAAFAALGLSRLPPWNPFHRAVNIDAYPRGPDSVASLGPGEFFESFNRGKRLVFFDDGPSATVAVVASAGDDDLTLYNNGKSDVATRHDSDVTRLLAHLPALLAKQAESAFIIGLGGGLTTRAALLHPTLRHIEVAEISPAVVRALPAFGPESARLLGDPRVRIRTGDGFRLLKRSGKKYDLIISHPPEPWVSGAENLFSTEFLRMARAKLNPGGVLAQWFHAYTVDEKTITLILRTSASVFPDLSVWHIGHQGDLLVLHADHPENAWPFDALQEGFQQADIKKSLAGIGIHSPAALLALELWPSGTARAWSAGGPLQKLERPLLSYWGSEAAFRGKDSVLGAPKLPEQSRESMLLERYRSFLGLRAWPPEEQRRILAATRGHPSLWHRYAAWFSGN